MNTMLKRILATLLCAAMILPMIPLQSVSASSDENLQPIELQAEHTDYTYVYKFNTIGPAIVGGITGVNKADWMTHEQAKSQGYFDKSNSPYISFQVEAPADGKYDVQVAYQYGSLLDGEHYATLVVNEGGADNVYKAVHPTAGTSGSIGTTAAVSVTLKKGINTIYCLPLTTEQFFDGGSNASWGSWADVDKFVLDGALKPVKKQEVVLNPGNATYIYKFNDRRDAALGGSDTGEMKNEKISIADLGDTAKLAKVPHIAYTVHAEKAGYYDITITTGAGTYRATDAIGLVVDGKVHTKVFEKHRDADGISWATQAHKADLSVWLEPGDHVLAITGLMPKDAAEAASYSYSWTDMAKLTLHGGLVASDIQVNPVTGEKSVEAASGEYVLANRYTAGTVGNRNVYGYAQLGSGNPFDNQTLADIEANGLNTANNAMATIFVFAPADGTYTFGARGEVQIPGLWDGSAWTTTPYFTFVVNEGKEVHKANFTGQNGWVSNSNKIEIPLKQGLNAISCIPMVKDLITGSGYWANMDCIFVDSELTVLGDMDFDSYEMSIVKALSGSNQVSKYVTLNRFNNLTQTSNSAFTDNKYIVGGVNAGDSYWPSTETLGNHVDRSNASIVTYYVDAPEAGEYHIGMHLQMSMNDGNVDDVFTTVIVNDGGNDNSGIYEVPFRGANGAWTTSFAKVKLEKGRNVVYIVLMNGAFSQSRSDWANFDCVMLDARLTAVEAKDTLVNTGSSAYITGYRNIGTSVGGGIRPSVDVAIDTLKPEQINSSINSISFTVNAPVDGYYDIFVGFGFGGGVQDGAIAYLVDGVAEAREYSYMGDSSNNHGHGENYIDLGTYLTAGDHVITITCPLKRTASDTITLTDWCDLRNLHLTGGLSLAATQKDPTNLGGGSDGDDTSTMKVVEAENSYWNRYGNTGAPNYIEAGAAPEASGSASGGFVVGAAWQNNNQSFEDIKNNGLDSSNTAYIGYVVEAPADGEYYISSRVFINTGSDWSAFKPYGVFVVNGTDVIKAGYTGSNNAFNETELVKVSLKQGINSIIFVPRPRDSALAPDAGWANVDCLKIDSALTPVEKVTLKLDPTEGIFYKYNDNGTSLGGAQTDVVGADKLAANAVTSAKLSGIPSFSYTLTAAKDGYYDIVMKFTNTTTQVADLAFAVLVDGKLTTAQIFSDKGQSGCVGKLHLTIPLTAGDHVLSITMALPKSASTAANISYAALWTDIKELHVIGGLSKAATQKDPTTVLGVDPGEPDLDPDHFVYVEAEDQDYSQWFNYSSVEDNPNCSGGKLVGNGIPTGNPTLAALQANPNMDLSAAAGFKIVVDAPIADDYYIIPRYMIRDTAVDPSSDMDPDPYVVIVVNGKVYTAANTSKNDWVTNCEPVLVSLNAGENEIFIIPMIMDLLEAGYDYANYDCTILEGRLSAVKQEAVVIDRVEAEDLYHVQWNKYSSAGANPNASGGYYVENAWGLDNVAFSQLKNGVDLTETAFIVFKVIAPEEGEYTFSARYSFRTRAQDPSTDFTGEKPYLTFFVNGSAYKVNNVTKNDWLADTTEVMISLKKGENTIYVIPLTAEQEATFAPNGEECWANIDCVYIEPTLTPVETGYVAPPDNSDRPRVEAEDTVYTEWNGYNATEQSNNYSNGLVASGSHSGNNVYLKDLVPGVSLVNTAHLKWTFNAPKAGYYKFAVRFNLKAGNLANGAELKPEGYATFWINDAKVYKAPLTGSGAKSGWVSDSQDVEIWLEAGENSIVLIPMIRDLYNAYGTGWSNVDCLYYDDTLTVKKAPVYTRIDAINSEYFGYIPESGRLMREDYNSTFNNKMTFDRLTMETINNISWVKYTVQAQSAGVYRIGIGFDEGGDLPDAAVYTAMSVNKGAFVKVPFIHQESAHRRQLVYMDVKLNAGENTILITSALAEFFTDKGKAQLYIDHSHLMLPEGVYGFISDGTPSWTGDADADIGDSLDSVWGDTSGYEPDDGNGNDGPSTDTTDPSEPGKPGDPTDPTEGTKPSGGGQGAEPAGEPSLIWLWVLIALVVICGGGYVIYLRTKKRNA